MLSQTITDFVTLAIEAGGWMEMDRLYLQNRVLAMIGENQFEKSEIRKVSQSSTTLLDELIAVAKRNQLIDETLSATEILEGELMDLLTPPPSVTNAFFAQHYAKDPQDATDYFFKLCKNNDYIKTRAIAKNIYFPVETKYGQLEITINLSKPEKDPKQIAAERNASSSSYPKCLLCMENEGYRGRVNHPARTNHRIIRMNIDGEAWGFQYSPYAYYNEHCIVLSEEHRPMSINQDTFERLTRIVEILPHYLVGSNADLPIVGGSILSHDHYQGGKHDFAMAKAPINRSVELQDYSEVQVGIVQWPMSVIRLQSKNREALVSLAEHIRVKWTEFSAPELSIVAKSEDGTPHHTVTPIARQKAGMFELDLVLRDNNISEEHPDGIFHPHQDVHHIKKENIGLIEVMGLAILPPRLEQELAEIEAFLLDQEATVAEHHRPWVERMKNNYQFSVENVKGILEEEIGQIFVRVLEDAGVFKHDVAGQEAFDQFMATL